MTTVEIVKTDISQLNVDVIVDVKNAAMGEGGSAKGNFFVLVPGFQVKAKSVLYASEPLWESDSRKGSLRLKTWYKDTLRRAKECGFSSIAYPVLSWGEGSLLAEGAWEIALKTIFHEDSIEKVCIAVEDDQTLAVGLRMLASISSEASVLEKLDRNKLSRHIETLCRIRKIDWEPGGMREDGVWTLAKPRYPEELMQVFTLIPEPEGSKDNKDAGAGKNVACTDMTASQIRSKLNSIRCGERFYTGAIAESVENGSLLKMLLRLEDLLEKYRSIGEG